MNKDQLAYAEALSNMALMGREMRISGAQSVVAALESLRKGARPDELAGIDAAISVAKQKRSDMRREDVPAITFKGLRWG